MQLFEKKVWEFLVGDERDYGIGETEKEAVHDLAMRRNCEAVAFIDSEPGKLGDQRGGWVFVIHGARDLRCSRGVLVPSDPPIR